MGTTAKTVLLVALAVISKQLVLPRLKKYRKLTKTVFP